MSYQSPIDIIYGQLRYEMEDAVMKAVQDVGINVNKIELQKALMYDRKQYTQGFEDGRKYEQEKLVHCKDCIHREKTPLSVCISVESAKHSFFCELTDIVVTENYYCGDGERETNEMQGV